MESGVHEELPFEALEHRRGEEGRLSQERLRRVHVERRFLELGVHLGEEVKGSEAEGAGKVAVV